MYISLFWCGVLATVGIEILAIIVFAIIDHCKRKNKF